MTFTPNFEALRDAAMGVDDPKILDGRAVAKALRNEVKVGVDMLRDQRSPLDCTVPTSPRSVKTPSLRPLFQQVRYTQVPL